MVKKKSVLDDDIFEKIDSEIQDREVDSAAYKITTYGADFTLEVLYNKIKDHEIVIPPFQRKYVWSPIKASKLIESFLLGLPVPQIFLYREEDNQDLLVVDGQQRLKTIFYFFDEKFENKGQFYLRGVKEAWEGKKYNDLSEPDKRRFKNSILRATIFEQTDPKDRSSIFEIFERLNTGGMALTQQEVRNCVIRGEINKMLDTLNEYESWRRLFGKTNPDLRMRDIEMILRFFALYEKQAKYKKPMKDFISDFMREKKDLSKKEQGRYSDLFKNVTDLIDREIGTRAFKLKAGINIAMFDSITVALARIGAKKVKNVKAKYKELITNDGYLDSISKSTTDTDRVNSRIKIAYQVLSK